MLTIYEKPTCSTCRKLRELLDQRGVAYETVDYSRDGIDAATLTAVLSKAGIGPRDALRTRGDLLERNGITDEQPGDERLIELIVADPDLLQRPLVVAGDRAVLARPIERALKLL